MNLILDLLRSIGYITILMKDSTLMTSEDEMSCYSYRQDIHYGWKKKRSRERTAIAITMRFEEGFLPGSGVALLNPIKLSKLGAE